MKRFTFLTAACTLALSGVAQAADGPVCDKFVASLKKAVASAGKTMKDDDAAFWKRQCGKAPNADVEKQTKCMDGAKSDADMKACFKM